MKYTRYDMCGIHSTHTVEADTPKEAAVKFREEMQEAALRNYESGVRPFYIDMNKVDYIPEFWSKEITFYDEEGLAEYDAEGHELPTDEDEYKDIGFVWGLKSWDDLSGNDAGLYTMNDIEICFREGLYELSIEEIYQFETPHEQIKYLETLALRLKDFVKSKGATDEELDNLYDCSSFSRYYPTEVMADAMELSSPTLVDLYRKFRIFVIAYAAVRKAVSKSD